MESSPGLLEIEITESIRNAPEIDLRAHRETAPGRIYSCLDDFGTEYVNLSLLSSVEFDVLKLDKTMVDDMVNNPKAQAIIESIAGICKKMGIRVVAEGIETEEQMSGALRYLAGWRQPRDTCSAGPYLWRR